MDYHIFIIWNVILFKVIVVQYLIVKHFNMSECRKKFLCLLNFPIVHKINKTKYYHLKKIFFIFTKVFSLHMWLYVLFFYILNVANQNIMFQKLIS